MSLMTRRNFLKTGAAGAAALGAAPLTAGFSPLITGSDRDMVFRMTPHPSSPDPDFAYATDAADEPFLSSMHVSREGIVVPADFGDQRFAVNLRWFVEGFGYVWLAADNGGELFTRSGLAGAREFNLNLEFARSRVSRNSRVRKRYEAAGTKFSPEVHHQMAASEELLANASKPGTDDSRAARLSDRALLFALRAGEQIELEHARSRIERHPRSGPVWFGCETRQFVWAKSEDTISRFLELFNFATVTHYVWDTWYEVFEPREGVYNWGIKDNIVNRLSDYGITIQGRPIYWPHPSVTPDWLKEKDFDGVKRYLAKHARDLVSHYGDRVLQWEIVNEMHDWANIHNFNPDQITDLVRLACDTTKTTNPKVVRILNNCCPFAEYVARGRQARVRATRPVRSPHRFMRDLTEAGVEYDVLGVQIYFPQRDLSDIVRLLERFESFGKPIYITEIGASSNLLAPTSTGAVTGSPGEPYAWHRHWDEDLQADWLEQVYTLYYSRPSIKAVNWYDFSDFRPFIINGGLVREDGSPKRSFHRAKQLLESWDNLPKGGGQ